MPTAHTARMSAEPAWTWEHNAYGRGDGFHYARRRSDDGVERHCDGQPCACPNAAAYAPMTPSRAVAWWALAFLALDRSYPRYTLHVTLSTAARYWMLNGLTSPWQVAQFLRVH